MSKPYDATGKDLIADYPADWLRFLGRTAPGVEVIDTDLSTVTAASDKVLKVLDADPWLLHAELQSGPRTDLDEQLHWYNTLIGHRHRMRVRSCLILLRRCDPPTTAVQLQRRVESWFATGAYSKRASALPLPAISTDLQHAVVAAEDARFWSHHGVDWQAVREAQRDNLRRGRSWRGGSTITQQLVKNLFLTTRGG